MKHCKYCAQTDTKLDCYGYCVKYQCFEASGERRKLDELIKRASNLIIVPDRSVSLNIISHVSNYYNQRTRAANKIMSDAKKLFNFVPNDVLRHIEQKHRVAWDKDIRW